jgi:phosphopantetheine adenylyltransferase
LSNRQQQSLFWFSHEINIYEKKYLKKSVKRKEKKIILDWDNCSVNLVGRLANGKTRLVLRTRTNRNSSYMGDKPIRLRFMLGIDISHLSDIHIEFYQLSKSAKNLPKSIAKQPHKRYLFQLDDRYCIWEWAKNGTDIKSTNIYKLYNQILSFIKETDIDIIKSLQGNNIFDVEIKENEKENEIKNKVVPIIYQPAFDSLRNFVREVHCAAIEQNIIEVSIIFENEHLRRYKYLNKIYEIYRHLRYGRVKDIETFRIYIDSQIRNDSKKYFTFERIYSNGYDITYDTIHGNPFPPEIKVKYYFIDYYHPIVFINTSNHAMSESDNNHDLWKWEYIPFIESKKRPFKFGTKSRKDIDKEFPSLFTRLKSMLSGNRIC